LKEFFNAELEKMKSKSKKDKESWNKKYNSKCDEYEEQID